MQNSQQNFIITFQNLFMRIKNLFVFISILFFSLAAEAQKKDTLPPAIPDTIPLVSNRQINEVLMHMRKIMSIEETVIYQELVRMLQEAINQGVIDYLRRKKVK